MVGFLGGVLKDAGQWVIYGCMALIFAIGIVKCVLPMLSIRKALIRGTERAGERTEDGAYLYDDPNFFGCRYLDAWWERYVVNLREMRRSNAECDVIGFINTNTVILSNGHSQFAELLPGVMTSLGILGTFVGLVNGLSGLKVSGATVGQMQQSIAVLIEGMNSAFYTSIVGVICAVCFQIIRRLAIASATNALNRFVQVCQSVVSRPYTQDTKLIRAIYSLLIEVRKSNEAVQEVLKRNLESD